MDLVALKTELTTDPLSRGYAGMTDEEAATNLNTVDRTRNKTSMTGSEVVNNVDAAEWVALSGEEQAKVWDILHLGTLNPFGVEAALLIAIFGGGSATIIALQAARVDAVSRAEELGLGSIAPGHVENARY